MNETAQADAGRFDEWTRDYALLGLRLDRLAPGTVDAWTGPPAWAATSLDDGAQTQRASAG